MRPPSIRANSAARPRLRLTELALLGLVLAGFGIFVARHATIAPAGADASGYFNLARTLLHAQSHALPRTIEGLPMATLPPFVYCPLGFVPDTVAGHITPTYPPGLSLLFAIASLCGWSAGPLLVMALHAGAGLAIAYALVRQTGLSTPWAWLGVLVLGSSPLYLAYAVQAMSDLPALVWCSLALWLASRDGRRSAAACGLAFGMAVLLRPTNALLAAPLALVLGRPSGRWIWFAAGTLPAALGFGALNYFSFGSVLTTGYGNIGEYLSRQWLSASLGHYLRWLPVALSPLFLCALAAPFNTRRFGRTLAAHALWVLLIAGFYSFYYFTHREWWYLRFLLPAFPSLILLALAGGEAIAAHITHRAVRASLWLATALLVLVPAPRYWSELDIAGIGAAGGNFTELCATVAATVPPNGVVLCLEGSGALYFSTHYCIVRWDTMDDAWPRLRDGARLANRPIFAALLSFEDKDRFQRLAPGNWQPVAHRGLTTIWQLTP
ncbi:MAG: hypothetical protein KF715_07040 [Candidatus Didemnitutus sp.]|nr:hypothetical protein [Candidatus Didemnitutus sp.]